MRNHRRSDGLGYRALKPCYPWIGVDPGSTSGALVVLSPDGRSVVMWMAYTKVKSGIRATDWHGGKGVCGGLCPAIRGIAGWVLEDVSGYRLAVEGLYVPVASQKRKATRVNVAAMVPLYESAGMWLAFLLAGQVGEPWRPQAKAWRMRQLGVSQKIGRKALDEASVQGALRTLRWPKTLGLTALTVEERIAVCDAAWIARDGWSMQGRVNG